MDKLNDPFPFKKESEKGEPSKPSIAIVGAGISGLSTARRLIELGIDNFDIYEGLDRIGGRIHAIPYSKSTNSLLYSIKSYYRGWFLANGSSVYQRS